MKKGFYVGLFIALVAAFILNLKKIEQPKKVEAAITSAKKLEFCDERVPIERPIVYKRLQQQITNTLKNCSPQVISNYRNSFAFSYIEKELEKCGFPADLKYVPIIESGLIARRHSEKEAVGWWQFIKSTAGQYELSINDYIDQRCDLFASTEKALIFLKDLLVRFKNWPDALAGYNMHQDAYGAAKIKQGAQNYYQVENLPVETQEFVYKIIAMKLIMENPEKYGYPKIQVKPTNFNNWKIHKAVIDIEGEVLIPRIIQELKDNYPSWNPSDFTDDNPHILRNILSTGSYYFYVYERNGTS